MGGGAASAVGQYPLAAPSLQRLTFLDGGNQDRGAAQQGRIDEAVLALGAAPDM